MTDITASKKKASILPVICKAFGPAFIVGTILKLIDDLLIFLSPQILRHIIKFIQTSSSVQNTVKNESIVFGVSSAVEAREPLWHGVCFAIALFAVACLKTFLKTQHLHRMSIVGQRIRTALMGAVFRKALVLSNSARKRLTVGEMVNLMAVDAQRFKDVTDLVNVIWSAPLQVALALYFLWDILGASVLAGDKLSSGAVN